MNKRISAAVMLAGAVIFIGVAAVTSTSFIADEIEIQIKQLQQDPRNTESLEQFISEWESYEKILSCYTRHSEIESIESSVSMLKCLQREDEQLFRIECSNIIAAARHMKETEIPYLKNIL